MKTRIAVYTTPEFKKQLKVYAALKSKSLSEIIHEALIAYLDKQRQTSA